MDEKALVKKLNRHSRSALEQAVRQFTPYVNTVIIRTLSGRASREDAEELAADVFLTMWNHAGDLDSSQGLHPWLATVARNKAADWLRLHHSCEPLPEDLPDTSANPEQQAEQREWASRLWAAVSSLPEPDRTLFIRYYYQEEKLKTIAQEFGLKQSAAKQRLFRGRKALNNVLHTFFHGDSDDYALSLVNAEQNSISDENYTMTVTSSIADERHVYFTLTIEPKTEKARYFLSGNGEEYFTLPLMFRHAWSDNFSGGMFCGPSSDNPDIFCAEIRWNIKLGLQKTVYVRMDDMEEGLWLKIPLKPVSSVKLDIQEGNQGMSGSGVTLKTVEISPLTVRVSYSTIAGGPVLYYLWKDGTLNSFAQLEMNTTSTRSDRMDNGLREVKSTWEFGHVQDIREMEAIVYENMAYPLDGGEPYEYERDPSQSLLPYTLPEGG